MSLFRIANMEFRARTSEIQILKISRFKRPKVYISILSPSSGWSIWQDWFMSIYLDHWHHPTKSFAGKWMTPRIEPCISHSETCPLFFSVLRRDKIATALFRSYWALARSQSYEVKRKSSPLDAKIWTKLQTDRYMAKLCDEKSIPSAENGSKSNDTIEITQLICFLASAESAK